MVQDRRDKDLRDKDLRAKDLRDNDLRDKDLRNKVQVQVQETLTKWINKTSKKHLSTRFV